MKQVTNNTIINNIKTSQIYLTTARRINAIKEEVNDKLVQELVEDNNVVSIILTTGKDIKFRQELGVVTNNAFVPNKLISYVNTTQMYPNKK